MIDIAYLKDISFIKMLALLALTLLASALLVLALLALAL